MHIHQAYLGSGHTSYLLGRSDFDWSPVILDMFAGTLDKLWIDNQWFPAYLTLGNADLIREVYWLFLKFYILFFPAPSNNRQESVVQSDVQCLRKWAEIQRQWTRSKRCLIFVFSHLHIWYFLFCFELYQFLQRTAQGTIQILRNRDVPIPWPFSIYQELMNNLMIEDPYSSRIVICFLISYC